MSENRPREVARPLVFTSIPYPKRRGEGTRVLCLVAIEFPSVKCSEMCQAHEGVGGWWQSWLSRIPALSHGHQPQPYQLSAP